MFNLLLSGRTKNDLREIFSLWPIYFEIVIDILFQGRVWLNWSKLMYPEQLIYEFLFALTNYDSCLIMLSNSKLKFSVSVLVQWRRTNPKLNTARHTQNFYNISTLITFYLISIPHIEVISQRTSLHRIADEKHKYDRMKTAELKIDGLTFIL